MDEAIPGEEPVKAEPAAAAPDAAPADPATAEAMAMARAAEAAIQQEEGATEDAALYGARRRGGYSTRGG